jgi:hypothetical protein
MSFPLTQFQAARTCMTFYSRLLLLSLRFLPGLAWLWHLAWSHHGLPHLSAKTVHPMVRRLLKLRTPLDYPACRLSPFCASACFAADSAHAAARTSGAALPPADASYSCGENSATMDGRRSAFVPIATGSRLRAKKACCGCHVMAWRDG